MNSRKQLLKDIKNQDYIKRLNRLETIIDEDKEIKELIEQKQHISKEIMAAKQLGLLNTIAFYEQEYKKVDEAISNKPLVSEYMDLLEMAHNDLEFIISTIEKEINNRLK